MSAIPKEEEPSATAHVGARPSALVNLASNASVFGATAVVGLWFVPFQIEHLGIAVYGLIPLAAAIVANLNVLTSGMNTAMARHISYGMNSQTNAMLGRAFSTALMMTTAIVLGLSGLAAIIVWQLPAIIRVHSAQSLGDARWLFALVAAGFVLTTARAPFDVATFVHERFDVRSAIGLAELLVRVGTVVVAFAITTPRAWHVGLGVALAATVGVAAASRQFVKLTPALRLSRHGFDTALAGVMLRSTVWITINSIGSTLLVGVDLWVANRILGPVNGGMYAAVLLWSVMLRALASSLVAVASPRLIALFAKGDNVGAVAVTRAYVSMLGLVVGLPIALLLGFGGEILSLWLGPSFEGWSAVQSLLVVHLGVNLALLPLLSLQVALNAVKIPALVTCAAGVLNLMLAIVLAKTSLGPLGIALAGGVTLSLKNVCFTPLYAASLAGVPARRFISPATHGLVLSGAALALSWGVKTLVGADTPGKTFLSVGLVAASYCVGAVAWGRWWRASERRDGVSR